MTTTTVSTSAGLVTALEGAGTGDIIKVTGGNKTGQVNIVRTSGSQLNLIDVVVEPEDINNPPTWSETPANTGSSPCWHMEYVNGVTFRGLRWYGTRVEQTDTAGVDYPNGTAMHLENCDDLAFEDCRLKFWFNGMLNKGGGTINGLRWSRCEFWQFQNDILNRSGNANDFTYEELVFHSPRIYKPQQDILGRHTDAIMFIAGGGQSHRIKVRKCSFTNPDNKYSNKPVFFSNPDVIDGLATLAQKGFVDCEVTDCDIVSSRSHGIYAAGTVDMLIDGNRIRYPAGTNPEEHKPKINCYGVSSGGIIRNNSHEKPIFYSGGGAASQWAITDQKSSNTTSPDDFVSRVNGTNCGPYWNVSGPTKPVKPTIAASHGQFLGTEESPTHPGRYVGVLEIPSAAPAAVVGSVVARLRWTDPSRTSPGPMEEANPSTGSASQKRYAMRASGSGTGYSVLPGGTLTGVTWEYQGDNGTWSDMSTYTATITGPTVVTPTLAALTASQWEFIASVFEAEGLPGRHMQLLRIIPGVGPTYGGLEWTIDGESPAVWRQLLNTGLDGTSAIKWMMQPFAPNGLEHTVPYLGTLNIRLRYRVDETFSAQSTTAKGFTGPAAPAGPTGYDPGDRLRFGGVLGVLGRRRMIMADPDLPALVQGDITISNVSGTVTVETSSSPPPLADWIEVNYASGRYVVVDGVVSFPKVAGAAGSFCMVRGVRALPLTPGVSRPVSVP